MSKLYTIGEVAKALNVALVTIRRWEEEGYVNVIHTPVGHRRIEENEFHRLLGIKELEKERGAEGEVYHESTSS